MQEVQGLKDIAKTLAGGNYRFTVYVDGNPVFKGKKKTSDVIGQFGSVTAFLESLDLPAGNVSVHYGKSNGSSWLNPSWMLWKRSGASIQAPQVTQPMSLFSDQIDIVGLNGIEQPGDSMESLKAKNWVVVREYQRIKKDWEELKAKYDRAKAKKEDLEDDFRKLRRQLEDLKYEHSRELAAQAKPGFLEKLMDNEEVTSKALDILGNMAEGGSRGLNGAGLGDSGQYVVDAMKSNPNHLPNALARIIYAMQNPAFNQELNGLLHRFNQDQQNQEITVNA